MTEAGSLPMEEAVAASGEDAVETLPSLPALPEPKLQQLPTKWVRSETDALVIAWVKIQVTGVSNLAQWHWDEIATAVNAGKAPDASDIKSTVQCRSKMDTLKKTERRMLHRAQAGEEVTWQYWNAFRTASEYGLKRKRSIDGEALEAPRKRPSLSDIERVVTGDGGRSGEGGGVHLDFGLNGGFDFRDDGGEGGEGPSSLARDESTEGENNLKPREANDDRGNASVSETKSFFTSKQKKRDVHGKGILDTFAKALVSLDERKAGMFLKAEKEKLAIKEVFAKEKLAIKEKYAKEKLAMKERFENEKLQMREKAERDKLEMKEEFEKERLALKDSYANEKISMKEEYARTRETEHLLRDKQKADWERMMLEVELRMTKENRA